MPQSQLKKGNRMAMASLILGIIALFSLLNVYYAVFLGSLSILLASLSRGGGLKMSGQAIGGTAVSAFAIVCSVLLTVFSMYMMIRMFGLETALNPEALQEAIMELYEKLLNTSPAGGAAL